MPRPENVEPNDTAEAIMEQWSNVEASIENLLVRVSNFQSENAPDKAAGRWLSLGRTDLEKGMDWLEKAVRSPRKSLGRAR